MSTSLSNRLERFHAAFHRPLYNGNVHKFTRNFLLAVLGMMAPMSIAGYICYSLDLSEGVGTTMLFAVTLPLLCGGLWLLTPDFSRRHGEPPLARKEKPRPRPGLSHKLQAH